ncbi:endonuclease domain-containing protein [Sporosarcina sp. ACRSL]|uniref:DUF559 domain-containing protein n=1 Tax=Sporosarcina sp. ACRSL TaxID=2918215 RepID=UPI001EF3F892|nr:DUF559 domain-containing protein [Sporosarcina sp. ACRSL]MCG7345320.1 endonuclease domain-containing protein [Sporosarcina sp. ACRSL]
MQNYKNENWLRTEYKDKGLSATTIARNEGVSETTITYYLKKFKLHEKGRMGDKFRKTKRNTFKVVKCSNCGTPTNKSIEEIERTDRVNNAEMYCTRECADKAHSLRMRGERNPNFEGEWYGPDPSTILTAEERRENALRAIQARKENGTHDESMKKLHEGHKAFFSTPEGKQLRVKNGVKSAALFRDGRRTSIEIKMAEELERRGIKFIEQFNLDNIFVPDFYLPEYRIIVECDGDYWHNLPSVIKKDNRKNAYYKSRNYSYFRFWEHEINTDVEACVDIVLAEINAKEAIA